MIRRHIETLRLLAEAQNPVFRTRFAAAIILKNRVISYGYNQEKTHPFAHDFARHPDALFWHAETNAIFNARKKISDADLKKAKLVVVRIKNVHPTDDVHYNNKDVFGLAKPCKGCQKCIETYGIKTVVYSLDSTFSHPHYAVAEY
jgi:deoxycytidylate deaminase